MQFLSGTVFFTLCFRACRCIILVKQWWNLSDKWLVTLSQCPTKTLCVPMPKQSSRMLLSLVSFKSLCHKFALSASFLQLCISFSSIGNGPSAITLSYLLSGHVPYYRGNSSDDFLHLRLSENIEQPLVLQDLEFLSDVSYFSVYTATFQYSSLNQLFRDWKADQPILYQCYLTR